MNELTNVRRGSGDYIVALDEYQDGSFLFCGPSCPHKAVTQEFNRIEVCRLYTISTLEGVIPGVMRRFRTLTGDRRPARLERCLEEYP